MSSGSTDTHVCFQSPGCVLQQVTLVLKLVFEGLVHATGKKLKPDRTEPQHNWTISCSSGFSEMKNCTQPGRFELVAAGLWYLLKMRTF